MTRTFGLEQLEIQNIGRRFGGAQALVDFDLTVRGGEFVALLGPSGCGKSTALNCLAGLLPLSSGRVLIDGKRVDTLPSERRDFGMVFQNYALFPHMSVRKNIAFGLEMRRLPQAVIRQRVEETLALVKLEAHADKLPGQLSGGQQQRVAIARAVVVQPRLVLMDEPLSNLDAKLRLEMRAEIRKLHKALGLTTIYVTHDQEEALSMADRLVVLKDGHIQQVGTPEEVYDQPANWYVADFMGYRNLIDVTVDEVHGDQVVVSADGLKLRATAKGTLRAGATARLAIRPTDLAVVQKGSPTRDGNSFEALPTLVEYQGRSFAVELAGPGGATIHARLAAPAPQPGSPVSLTVAGDRALVFPAALDSDIVVEEAA